MSKRFAAKWDATQDRLRSRAAKAADGSFDQHSALLRLRLVQSVRARWFDHLWCVGGGRRQLGFVPHRSRHKHLISIFLSLRKDNPSAFVLLDVLPDREHVSIAVRNRVPPVLNVFRFPRDETTCTIEAAEGVLDAYLDKLAHARNSGQ